MSNNRTYAGPARVIETKEQSRLRRRRLSFVIGAIWALAAMLSLANAVWLYQRSAGGAQTDDADEATMGRIVRQTDDQQCALGNFDNDTGRIIENSKHCDNMVKYDAHGVPIPSGTIHRLDAIRDYFSGDGH